MKTYRILKEDGFFLKNFASPELAQAYADGLGEEYTAILASENEQIQETSNADKVNQDLDFGISLIKLFRTDNADYEKANNVTITVAESVALMQKFQGLIGFCQVGAIAEAYAILPTIVIDSIFTQERKDKYLTTLQNYLGL